MLTLSMLISKIAALFIGAFPRFYFLVTFLNFRVLHLRCEYLFYFFKIAPVETLNTPLKHFCCESTKIRNETNITTSISKDFQNVVTN